MQIYDLEAIDHTMDARKGNVIFLYVQTANKVSDCPSQTQLLALNHHVEWATLGFTRAIAASTAMCRALSTPAWVHLLLSMVGGQDNSIVITLPKQVCCVHDPLKPEFHLNNL